jgi:apolipoprotein N-acyltransferase
MAAGLLLAASFPKIGIAGFAWVAPALMLASALGKSGGESFRIGYVGGLAYYLASLYWLLLIPFRWHSIPFGPAAGWLALGAFLALYPATWVWLVLKVSSFECRATSEGAQKNSWLAAGEEISTWSWSRRTLWAVSCGAIWVALEMTLTRLFGGFPWILLGDSQFQMVPLIQIASVTGVYGISFLLVWTSISLLCAACRIYCKPALRSIWVAEIILPFAAVAAVFAFGFHRLSQSPAPDRTLKVTLCQPSIPQTLIWNSEADMQRFHDLLQLSEQALTNQTDVLIWPESAIPRPLRYDEEIFQAVTGLARSHGVWMIVGADDKEPGLSDPNEPVYFNASFLISPRGQLAERYCKRSLVIFGEYVPLERALPFVKWFTPITGSYTPGDRTVQFDLGDLRAKTSVLICFEDIFPQLARGSVEDDTDFLVNLTNDGWFGEGAAQWQHAAAAAFRAVENGLPLIRCTNTGLTCWIDANGRMRKIFADKNGSVYGAGFMTAEIPLLAAGEKRAPTFYHQHGDWFGWACTAFAAILIARMLLLRARN